MKHLNADGEPVPEEVLIARKTAVVEALVQEALDDETYCEALFIAAFNIVGFRSVTHSVPLDDLMERGRKIAQAARRHAAGQMLQ